MNKKHLLSILKYLLGLGSGVLLLYLALRNVDLGELLEKLRNANYEWVLLAIGIAILSHWFRAKRWQMLISAAGFEVRSSNAFALIMVNYLVNNAIPRAGEITRATLLTRTDKVPFSKGFATIVTDRVFDMLILGSMVLFFLVVESGKLAGIFGKSLEGLENKFAWFHVGYLWGGLVLLLVLGMVAFVLRERITSHRFTQKIWQTLKEMYHAVISVRNLDRPGLFVFYTLSIWVAYVMMTWLPFKALPESSHISLYYGVIIFTIGGIGMVIPSPGGIGSYHFAVKLTFVAFAADLGLTIEQAQTTGITLAAIIHTSQLLMMIVLGFLAYLFIVSRTSVKIPETNTEESAEATNLP